MNHLVIQIVGKVVLLLFLLFVAQWINRIFMRPLQSGPWQEQTSERRFICRSPKSLLWLYGGIGLFMAAMAWFFPLLIWSHQGPMETAADKANDVVVGWVALSICSSFALLSLYLAGTTKLEIDMETRIYRFTRRWGFVETVRHGSLDEVSGVICTIACIVKLNQKTGRDLSGKFTLGRYSNLAEGEAEAKRLAGELMLPLLPTPPMPGQRRNPNTK